MDNFDYRADGDEGVGGGSPLSNIGCFVFVLLAVIAALASMCS